MGVYKRKDTGRWEIRLQVRGVKYRRTVPEALNKQMARDAEATLRREIYEGRYGRKGEEIGATMFVEFCEQVFLPSIKDRLKQWRNEEYKVRLLCAYFKGKRLKDIKPMLIEGYKRKRLSEYTNRKRLRHPSAVKSEIATLSAIFTLAIENDLIGLNPCRKIRWGKGQTDCRRTRVLSEDEEARLLAQLEPFPEAYRACLLALNTGMRRMEILHLRTANVNLEARTLTFKGKGAKERTVPLNETAERVIRELLQTPTSDGYLFHVRTGHNLSASRGAFQLAVSRAKIKDLHFHDLRHTFSTRVRRVTDAFTLKALVGHSELSMTDRYVTPPLADMHAAVAQLDQPSSKVLQFERKTG